MSRDLLFTIDSLAREKGLKQPVVLGLLERALNWSWRRKEFGDERPLKEADGSLVYPHSVGIKTRVTIDSATGEIHAEKNEDGVVTEIEIGFDRSNASLVKGKLLELIRFAQRESKFDEMLDEESRMYRAQVRQIKKGNLYIELTGAFNGFEGVVLKEGRIPGVEYKIGANIEVFWENREQVEEYFDSDSTEKVLPKAIFNLNSKEWLGEFLRQEIVEVDEGIIEIKAIARKAGVRAKVAVLSNDASTNAIATIRGFKGARWKRISEYLAPEQVDFVNWSEDAISMVTDIYKNADIQKVLVDEDSNTIEIVVPEAAMPMVFGKFGANLSLTSEIVGWNIKVHTMEHWSKEEEEQLAWGKYLFKTLFLLNEEDVESVFKAGYSTVDDLMELDVNEAVSTGFLTREDWELLKTKALLFQNSPAHQEEWLWWDFIAVPKGVLLLLKGAGIKTVTETADYATDELLEIVPALSQKEAEQAIMACRAFLNGE